MRAALWLTLVPLSGAATVAAQVPAEARGRVLVARPADTSAVADARVVLHRVGPATQGPIDSAFTDARGHFRFRYPRDSSANYLVSTRYADIEYFSSALTRSTAAIDSGIDILVFDTSGTAPVAVSGRTLVIASPDPAGARTVVDWLTIVNRGAVTRVSPNSLTASWGIRLPDGAREPELGDRRFSQFSPEVVLFRNDSVMVTAPLAPGTKELVVQYQLPPEHRRFELAAVGVDSLDLFVEEAGVRSAGHDWVVSDSQPFQGRTFHRLRRRDASVDRIDLVFPGPAVDPRMALVALVSLLVVGLTAITGWRWRRGSRRTEHVPAEASAAPADPVATLTDRIARLDGIPETERGAGWMAERERLMTELRVALAERRR